MSVAERLIKDDKYEWHLPFSPLISQDSNWESKEKDEQRIMLIKQGLEDNRISETNWQEKIKTIKLSYGHSREGHSDFPVNFRCVCFEDPSGIESLHNAYVCIDLFSGKPYFSDEQGFQYPGGTMGTKYNQKELTWDEFLFYAKKISEDVFSYYSNINSDNWKDFLKADMVEFRIFG